MMSMTKDSFYGGMGGTTNNNGMTDRFLGSMIGGILDSEGFAVYSNVKFLYLIGKIASETGQAPEDGLNALNDYIALIEYFKEDVPEDIYQKCLIKAHFCIGMIFYKQRDFE
jgi:hypothetical protein